MDAYDRVVAVCRAGEIDLAGSMVSAGFAVALSDFSEDYLEAQTRAQLLKRGVWGSEFVQPSDYRFAHPRMEKAKPSTRSAQVRRRPSSGAGAVRAPGVYYHNCAEARAAGAAPLYRGQAGYRPEMDGDGDGVACEPYRKRR